MNAEEREQLIEAKARITADLAAVRLERYRLESVDVRIRDYIAGVAADPAGHCVWEQLAAYRFLGMCRRYGLDRAAVRRFFTLYESLYFPGKQGMQRYRLTPVQTFQFAAIYGFRRADGSRVVREACLYVPRKFSKTTSSAAFAVNDLMYGDANAESYTAANSSDQAKKCFDAIRGAVRRLDPDGRRYTVNEQVIKSTRPDRSAFAQCLTANAKTKDGLNASTVVMDEYSQAREATLLNVLTTSMGVRTNPLTVIITTASDQFDGPFYAMLQGYKAMLLGQAEDDDTVFAHLFEPDIDDPEDDPATWRKVHPHMGITVTEDFYRREYAAAKRTGADAMMAFRTKLLNVFSESTTKSWISAATAREAMIPVNIWDIKGKPEAKLGIDLSERDDFSAISAAIYRGSTHEMFFHTAYFFPRGALDGHPNEQLYRRWAAEGHLILLDGQVIDYNAIVEYVVHLSEVLDVTGIGYDGWKAKEAINMLSNAGGAAVLKEVKQTYGHFTSPVGTFEHGIYSGKIKMNDNPINAYCFGNAVIDEDRMENVKPVKRQRMGKIDGVITMLMALKLWLEDE